MTRRLRLRCGLALLVGLALPGLLQAGDVKLAIRDGRVTLSARDAPLRQILAEWERVGGTRVFNRDRTPATPITIELVDEAEGRALATLLRSVAGYAASERLDPATGASRYSRIVVMPGEAAAWASTASQPAAPSSSSSAGPGMGPGGGVGMRGPMQRRVLPDGRVVLGISDDQGEPFDEADLAAPGGLPPGGMMRPPFQGPSRSAQGQPAGGDEPTRIDIGQERGSPAMPSYVPAPAPGMSLTAPGVVPGTRPPPSAPIKPPRD